MKIHKIEKYIKSSLFDTEASFVPHSNLLLGQALEWRDLHIEGVWLAVKLSFQFNFKKNYFKLIYFDIFKLF